MAERSGAPVRGCGKRVGYKNGCRCEVCKSIERAYQAEYHRAAKVALGRPGRVPIARTVEAVRRHLEGGASMEEVGRRAGVAGSTIQALMARADVPGACVHSAIERAVLAARIPHVVTGVGLTRRIRALTYLGWTANDLRRESGLHRDTVKALRAGVVNVPSPATCTAVLDLYDRLWRRSPEGESRYERTVASRVSRMAQTRGWVPPLAWDDDSIDDPKAVPAGIYQGAARGVDVDEVEHLITTGEHPDNIATRLDRNRGAIRQACDRAGRRDLAHYMEKAA